MVEEAQVGVHQRDSQLVAGLDHHLVGSGAWRSSDELNAALETRGQTDMNTFNKY